MFIRSLVGLSLLSLPSLARAGFDIDYKVIDRNQRGEFYVSARSYPERFPERFSERVSS